MNNEFENSLRFLFSRMTWPTLLVRERACGSIATLLVDPEYNPIVKKELNNWIKSQCLESVAALGLLILLRAKIIDKNFDLIPYRELSKNLKKPSALTYWLLKELGYTKIALPNWEKYCLSDTPKHFVPSPFFEKYSTIFLPPIYKIEAINISQKCSVPFMQHWAYEWDVILKDMHKQPSSEPLHFRGRQEEIHYGPIDFVLSEVYRSAYLRTLAWAIFKKAISFTDVLYFAAKACPVDPALWRVKPSQAPKWWPTVSSKSNSAIDSTIPEIWQQISNLWNNQNTNHDAYILAQANGRVLYDQSVYDLEIQGCFQKCFGPRKPDLKEVMQWHQQRKHLDYISSTLSFEGIIQNEIPNSFVKDFGDWGILPVACQAWPNTTPRWQFWRLERGIWLPAPFLCKKNMEFHCTEEGVNVFENTKKIAKWDDWVFNLTEDEIANLPTPCGGYLLLNKEKIMSFAEMIDATFCWICKLTHFYRKHTYENYERFFDYQSYGASGIIRK